MGYREIESDADALKSSFDGPVSSIRRIPAAAIMAALSVDSDNGGTNSGRPIFAARAAASFLRRLFALAARLGAKSVGIAGGVSANSRLRKDAAARAVKIGLPLFVPPLSLSTDNAAMIAAAGIRRMELSGPSKLDFNASASLSISR